MTKHRQPSIKFKAKGKDLIWSQPITVLPFLGGRSQFAEKELASWWLPSSLGLALFSRMDNFFFLGFISGEMNSFSNSREICINGSVKHGSKLQKLAR